MTRWIALAPLLAACGGEAAAPPPSEPPPQAPSTPAPPPDATPEWLRALLAYDLDAPATDEGVIELGERLGAPVTCPQPGTGCYVELTLAGVVTQVHVGDDAAIQVWGPIEPFQMPPWVAGVEEQVDRSSLTALNDPGTRPDRLWRSPRRVLLLHDHSDQPCGGFCPAMMWLARPDHSAARGYGFPAE